MERITRTIGNVLQLAACYGYLLVRGRATRTPLNVRRVLVIQTAKLGDMVCSTPVFHALRTHIPHAYVVVGGSPINAEVLRDNGDVDEYMVVTDRPLVTLVSAIRDLRLDAACLLNPDSRMIAALFLAGVPLVVVPEVVDGFCPWQTKTYRLLSHLVSRALHHMGSYAPREYLRTLEPLGIHSEDTRKHLGYSEGTGKKAAAFLEAHHLAEGKFAVISPSAGNKIKNWPGDRFAHVAEYLVQKGWPVVLVGGPRDREEVQTMRASLTTHHGIIDASEQLSIDELKACISRAGLFVSVDTGPLYIAEAFGVATVDIVGPMDEREQPPHSPRNLVVVPSRTAPVLHIMNARMYNAKEARRQTESITEQMVIHAVDQLIIL